MNHPQYETFLLYALMLCFIAAWSYISLTQCHIIYLYLINLVDSVAAEIELVKGFLINQIYDVYFQITSPLSSSVSIADNVMIVAIDIFVIAPIQQTIT